MVSGCEFYRGNTYHFRGWCVHHQVGGKNTGSALLDLRLSHTGHSALELYAVHPDNTGPVHIDHL